MVNRAAPISTAPASRDQITGGGPKKPGLTARLDDWLIDRLFQPAIDAFGRGAGGRYILARWVLVADVAISAWISWILLEGTRHPFFTDYAMAVAIPLLPLAGIGLHIRAARRRGRGETAKDMPKERIVGAGFRRNMILFVVIQPLLLAIFHFVSPGIMFAMSGVVVGYELAYYAMACRPPPPSGVTRRAMAMNPWLLMVPDVVGPEPTEDTEGDSTSA